MKSLHFPILLLILSTSLLLSSRALAQSSTSPWSEPLNLSHSGAATNPLMVVDSEGTIHVFWTDEFDGPIYTNGDGDDWTEPIPVSLPFEGYIPLLLSDSGGGLHAFWIDADQVLRYASVLASAIPASGWNEDQFLADSIVTIDVEVDPQDRFHLAYLRTAGASEAPAGVYYRRSDRRGAAWGNSVLIYESPYFRKLTPDAAHVDVEIASPEDAGRVYVAWDNRPRSRIFLASTSDGGATWSDPQEIAEPDEGSGAAGPSDLTVYARDEKVLLVWQTGTQDTGCGQYYQWSLDGGRFWQPSQRFSGGFFGCTDRSHILDTQDGPILFPSSIQVSLLAWDGMRWSDPQIQSALTSFTDPETQQTVDLACRQSALFQDQLFVVGCSATGGSDIWFLQRDLIDTSAWFPQESVWQPLSSVNRNASPFLSLALVADLENRLHVFWSQASSDGDPSGFPDSALYYTRWEGERLWFQPVSILASPQEPADQPDVALGSAGRLFLAWRRGPQGEVYFSQATANLAPLPSAWTRPIRISAPGQMSSAPDILVSDDGVIYVAYAVPLNEGRGVYLTSSSDSGRSWSEPIPVFDGAAAGWTMLDQPRLAHTANGDLHLLWTRYNLNSGQPQPVALAYARSADGGQTWSGPEVVADNPVLWSYIVGFSESSVHRLWQELAAARTTLWHERSLDGGSTWERVSPVSIFGDTMANPSLASDRAGHLHLLQIVSHSLGGLVLQHWIWDGERWGGSGSLNLDVEEGIGIDDIASAVSPLGNLAVILSGRVEDQDLAIQEEELFFTARSVELPEILLTPLPPGTPIVIAEEPTLEPTPLPTPSPTLDLAALAPAGAASGSSWNGLMIGGALAGLIVTVTFGIGVWRAKRGK